MIRQTVAVADVPERLRVCPDGLPTVVVLSGRTRDYAACSSASCRRDAYAAVRLTDGMGGLIAESDVAHDGCVRCGHLAAGGCLHCEGCIAELADGQACG